MEKELIYARFTSSFEIERYMINELEGKIEYKYMFHERRIVTKNVDVKCIIISNGVDDQRDRVKGLKANVCFGFDKKTEDYLTRGKMEYKGSLTYYILEKNK